MPANYSSQQPSDYSPIFSQITTVSTTWGSGGNTCTITDGSVHPSSCVVVNATGTPAGFWKFAVTQGQIVITSSDSENSTLGLNYQLL